MNYKDSAKISSQLKLGIASTTQGQKLIQSSRLTAKETLIAGLNSVVNNLNILFQIYFLNQNPIFFLKFDSSFKSLFRENFKNVSVTMLGILDDSTSASKKAVNIEFVLFLVSSSMTSNIANFTKILRSLNVSIPNSVELGIESSLISFSNNFFDGKNFYFKIRKRFDFLNEIEFI